jgi:hypothetical protein
MQSPVLKNAFDFSMWNLDILGNYKCSYTYKGKKKDYITSQFKSVTAANMSLMIAIVINFHIYATLINIWYMKSVTLLQFIDVL